MNKVIACLAIFLFFSFTTSKDYQKQIDDLKARVTILENKLNVFSHRIDSLQVAKTDPDKAKALYSPISPTSTPSSNTSSNNSSPSTNSTNSSGGNSQKSYGQCRATTKKGSRSSRSANANGYCWQHGG